MVRYARYTARTMRFAGRLKSSDSTCPPGASTRPISSMAVDRFGHVPQPVAGRHDIERAGRETAARACRRRGSRLARGARSALRFASSIIRSVMSRPTTRAPVAGERKRDVARAGRQIERARAGRRRGQRDQPPLPAPILAVGQRHGDEIVAVGDRRKQRAHIAALALRRGDAVGVATFSNSG